MNVTSDLFLILQYIYGALPPKMTATVQARLDREPQLRELLDRVNQAGRRNAHGTATVNSPSRLPEELVAAFVEGSFDAACCAQVEVACRNSPEALQELASAFRFHVEGVSPRLPPPPPGMRTRLERLLPEREPQRNGVAVASFPKPAASWRADRNRRRRRHTVVAALAASAVVVLAGLAWWAASEGFDRFVEGPVESRDEPPAPTAHSTPPGFVDHDDSPDEAGSSVRPPEPEGPGVGLPMEGDDPQPTPVPDAEGPSGSDTAPSPRRDPETVPQDGEQPRELRWSRVEGILAAMDDTSEEVWKGYRAGGRYAQRFATLGPSWAEAAADDGSSLVLDADTEIQIGARGETLVFRVVHGRAAIRGLSPGRSVVLHAASETVHLQTEEEASVGVDMRWAVPRLIVRRGRIRVNGTSVVGGRQLAVTPRGMSAWQPLEETTRWFDRPSQPVPRLPDDFLDGISRSHDLKSDLDARLDTLPAAQREILAQWTVGWTGYGSVVERLRHPDPGVRGPAVAWLVRLHHEDPRRLQTWRTLAASGGNPSTLRALARWLELGHSGARVPPGLANELTRGLVDDEVAVRYLAAMALESAFGVQVPYQALAPQRQRQRAAEEWRRWIAEQMRRAESRRRP